MDVLLTGLIAGIALVIPVGPMVLLLTSTTLQHGRGIGAYGALAMSTVDFTYALLTATFGAALVNSLADWVWPLRLVGSAILLFLAVQFFLHARKDFAGISDTPQMVSRGVTYVKFLGLTVINPATAFYFLGIIPSVAAANQNQSGLLTGFIFACGVFAASISWHLAVVGAATATKAFTKPKTQSAMRMAGAFLIAGLAIALLIK